MHGCRRRSARTAPHRPRDLAVGLLSGARPPTAILAAGDIDALGVLAAAHELGLRVPTDLSVVGYGDLGVAETAGLATIRAHVGEAGRIGAEILVAEIASASPVPASIRLAPELVLRATVRHSGHLRWDGDRRSTIGGTARTQSAPRQATRASGRGGGAEPCTIRHLAEFSTRAAPARRSQYHLRCLGSRGTHADESAAGWRHDPGWASLDRSIWSSAVVVFQLRIVMRLYAGVPMVLLSRLLVRWELSRCE